MKKVEVIIFLDHRDNYIHSNLNLPEGHLLDLTRFFFDESTTYEEMVSMLIQEQRLLPLDDSRLRYNLVLQAFEASYQDMNHHFLYPPRSLSEPVTLREEQTLASTHLTHLVMEEAEFEGPQAGGLGLQRPFYALYCAASIEIRDSPPPKNTPGSASPGWGEILSTLDHTASAITIVTALVIIYKWWSKKHAMPNADANSGSSESEIVAIRILMTDGTQPNFEEWLNDPARLKHYIDIFNQPSSSVKPLRAIFVLRKGNPLIVDVSESTQNNLQLNELLSYLNIDPVEK